MPGKCDLFNPPENTDPLIQRLEVIGKHAAPALYNAAEMKRVPLKFLWWPLAKIQAPSEPASTWRFW